MICSWISTKPVLSSIARVSVLYAMGRYARAVASRSRLAQLTKAEFAGRVLSSQRGTMSISTCSSHPNPGLRCLESIRFVDTPQDCVSTHLNICWYSPGQLCMLPFNIRMCIRSQESSSMPCQGDSTSRCWKVMLGGILGELINVRLLLERESLRLWLNQGEVHSKNLCVLREIFAEQISTVSHCFARPW